MSAARELIERMEREAGCRVDANGGDNMAMAGLFGALARALGQSAHAERDDVVAGVLIKHKMTPEYEQQKRGDAIMAEMLVGGMSPDDLGALFGRR